MRTLEFLGGVPRQIVPDNLRAGVLRANWYEPGINPTYRDLAAHYGAAILPTRVRRPRDKAKVEAGVLVVERWILARLRHQRFFSLVELNAAIATLIEDLNARPMRKLGVSRGQLFEQLDKPALSPLPSEPGDAEWRIRRVALDYHVDIEGHYYSVPHRLLREQVEARITARTIELFHKGDRVAVHVRGGARGRHTTLRHMPRAHRRHAEWTIERIGREAAAIGPATATLTTLILRAGRTRNRASGLALASCAWRAATAANGWKRPAREGSRSAPLLRQRSVDPAARAGSSSALRQPPHRRIAAAASEHPWFRLLPLRRTELLTHPTLEQLRQLGLAGMARAFEELAASTRGAELDHAEWLGLLLDREMADRQDRRLMARLRYARLRHNAAVEDVDYRTARGLDRALFQKLRQLDQGTAEPDHHWPEWRREVVARLRTRASSVPRQSLRPVSEDPTPVQRSRAGTRRRSLRQVDARPWQREAAHP